MCKMEKAPRAEAPLRETDLAAHGSISPVDKPSQLSLQRTSELLRRQVRQAALPSRYDKLVSSHDRDHGHPPCGRRCAMTPSARRQRLVSHLHAAGPRPVLEALLEVAAGADLDRTLERFARVPVATYHALGADQLPAGAHSSRGGRMSTAADIAKALGGRAGWRGAGNYEAPCPCRGHGKGRGDLNCSLSLRDGDKGLLVQVPRRLRLTRHSRRNQAARTAQRSCCPGFADSKASARPRRLCARAMAPGAAD